MDLPSAGRSSKTWRWRSRFPRNFGFPHFESNAIIAAILEAGSRLGPYEIVAPLGAGGMGEVFRARDTRLDRSVAIKVLPAAYLNDAHLKTRFEREAKAISQLNHPHICALYDIGQQDGIDYLVMELIEGQTLADRLARGALPLADVVRYGVQIAGALEKAHRNGIVHRDLKPQNVMITKTGAKLLDFGLAKTTTIDLDADGSTVEQLTREGSIVGTFYYMSPEQLDGQQVDQRSDLFAFGAVLYEMVTGRRAFGGATKTSVIAAIVSGEPPSISNVQPPTPPALEQLIRACLAKDPDMRVQSAHDVALQLQWIAEGQSERDEARPHTNRLPWLITVVLALVLAGGAVYHVRSRVVSRPLRFTIEAPPNTSIDGAPAISPDGSRIVVRTLSADRSSMLWLRSLDSINAQPLKGTEGVTFAFWSADGKNIGFTARGKLWRLDPADGSVRTIYEPVEDPPGGATWNRDDVVIVAPKTGGTLLRVSASGGAATPLPAAEHEVQYWPSFLPDGDHYLYLREFGGPKLNGLYVGSLASKEVKRLIPSGADFTMSRVMYAAGNLYYAHYSSLYRQAFDPDKLAMRGEPVKIDEGVQFPAPGRASYSVSDTGTLVYRKAGPAIVAQLTFVDRAGKRGETFGDLVPYGSVALSPDEKRVAFTREEDTSSLWILDRPRGTSSRGALEIWAGNPIWLSDGRSLVYMAADNGPPNVYLRREGAQSECLKKTDVQNWPTSVTPDGRYAIFDYNDPKTMFDVYAISITAPHTQFAIVKSAFTEREGTVSPDGKWLAYVSDESGTKEIYAMAFHVVPVPSAAGRVQISNNGGMTPRWSRDGRELFYLHPDTKKLMAVKIDPSARELRASVPEALFPVPSALFDVSRAGQFLVTEDRVNSNAPGLTLVMK